MVDGLPLAAIITFVGMVITAAVSWGVVRTHTTANSEKVKELKVAQESHKSDFVELKTKHEQLAAEVRPQVTALNTKTQALEVQNARLIEGMDGIKGQLAEIKGMLNALLKREISH